MSPFLGLPHAASTWQIYYRTSVSLVDLATTYMGQQIDYRCSSVMITGTTGRTKDRERITRERRRKSLGVEIAHSVLT